MSLVLQPAPFLAAGNEMDRAEMDSVSAADGFEGFPLTSAASNVSHVGLSESGSVVCLPASVPPHSLPVGHVLPVVPEVQMVDVDTTILAPMTGVKNVECAGIAVGKPPHSSGCADVLSVELNYTAPPFVQTEIAFVPGIGYCRTEKGQNLTVFPFHVFQSTGSNKE